MTSARGLRRAGFSTFRAFRKASSALSILVRHLLLQEESIFEKDQDSQGKEEESYGGTYHGC